MSDVVRIGGQQVDSSLEHLSLVYGHLDDMEELRQLRMLPCLKSANFCGTNLDDVGLVHLAQVETLENLSLQETRISNDGLACLERLPKLQYLRLKDNVQLTNACVRHLVRLVGLVGLQIHETSINEDGLRQIATMTNLRDICVHVWDGNYSFDGLIEISAGMPECTILAKGRGEFTAGRFDGKWEA